MEANTISVKERNKPLEALRSKFNTAIVDESWQAHDQVTLTVKLNYLPEVVEEIYYRHNGWLANMAGNDERGMNGHYALYYVLSVEDEQDPNNNIWLTVKTLIPSHKPEFPSVTPRVPAAVWYEREVRDMFGLEPVGLPDKRRLVLPDDWPDQLYPLRKDAPDYRPDPVAEEENYKFIGVEDEGIVEVPVGPLHIANDEPGHFRLYVDGEYIVDADYRLFYVHRGIEKLAENRMDYQQVNFLAERICGICGYTHSVAYSSALEKANGIEVPLRGQYIRTILLEVERLHSHLLNIGVAAHLVGFDSGFMQFFRVREKSMQMAEILTGGRKTYGINLIGGVRRDILKEERDQVLKLVSEMRTEMKDLIDIMVNTTNFVARTEGVGRLDPKIARDYSPVGPNLRGSGFKRDARKIHPYAAYNKVSWNLISKDGCDVLSRQLIRAEEVLESLNIIEQCLNEMPPGPILVDRFNYKPYTFAIGHTEAPRGENVHWVMTGSDQKVYRLRVRASTYNNWPSLRYMFQGNLISDAPLIIASIDPCYSCCDRVTVVDVRKRKAKTIEYKKLEQYCQERKYSPLKL